MMYLLQASGNAKKGIYLKIFPWIFPSIIIYHSFKLKIEFEKNAEGVLETAWGLGQDIVEINSTRNNNKHKNELENEFICSKCFVLFRYV